MYSGVVPASFIADSNLVLILKLTYYCKTFQCVHAVRVYSARNLATTKYKYMEQLHTVAEALKYSLLKRTDLESCSRVG